MALFHRVPLAWLNLAHRPVRFTVFLAGIGFAVLLMFVQLGFWGALLDSVVAVIDHMDAQLVIINQAKYVLDMNEPFPLRRLAEARAVDGVKSVTPLYVRMAPWKTPLTSVELDGASFSIFGVATRDAEDPEPDHQLIRVLAFDPSSGAMRFPEVASHASLLRLGETALRDKQSKGIYHMPTGDFSTELCERRIRLVGGFNLGTDFSSNGNLIMSNENYATYFNGLTASANPLDDVEIGLVTLEDDKDPQEVKARLEAVLPSDVRVLTRDQYAQEERAFWQKSTPVGFVFLLGLVVGFVVGVIICSQILSSDIADHLAEYATLKAIGFTNRFLTRVVLGEALLLSLLAFLPGVIFSRAVYFVLHKATGLPMDLTLGRAAWVLGCTVLMCVISAFLAIGKVWVADPAEVF
jgi:putative ABC transport system permease protein